MSSLLPVLVVCFQNKQDFSGSTQQGNVTASHPFGTNKKNDGAVYKFYSICYPKKNTDTVFGLRECRISYFLLSINVMFNFPPPQMCVHSLKRWLHKLLICAYYLSRFYKWFQCSALCKFKTSQKYILPFISKECWFASTTSVPWGVFAQAPAYAEHPALSVLSI